MPAKTELAHLLRLEQRASEAVARLEDLTSGHVRPTSPEEPDQLRVTLEQLQQQRDDVLAAVDRALNLTSS